MFASLTDTMLAGAALRALRHWLFELGHENATIGAAAGGVPGVYPSFLASAILWRNVEAPGKASLFWSGRHHPCWTLAG